MHVVLIFENLKGYCMPFVKKSLLAPRLSDLKPKCIMFYSFAPNELPVTTETMNVETLKMWMEVSNVRHANYQGELAESVIEFLNRSSFTKSENGWTSPEFLCLIGRKKLLSKCWVVVKVEE